MDNDFLATLRRALAVATSQLSDVEAAAVTAQEHLDRERAKAKQLRELIGLYEAETAVRGDEAPLQPKARQSRPRDKGQSKVSSPPHRTAPRQPTSLRPRDSDDTKRAAIIALLRRRGSVHRKEILACLQTLGLMMTERDPLAQLSAFLHKNRAVFVSHGKGQFSLRSPSPADANNVPHHQPLAPEPTDETSVDNLTLQHTKPIMDPEDFARGVQQALHKDAPEPEPRLSEKTQAEADANDILTYLLQRNGGATATAIANALRASIKSVESHLRQLQARGTLIVQSGFWILADEQRNRRSL
jgi:hypothetical protein